MYRLAALTVVLALKRCESFLSIPSSYASGTKVRPPQAYRFPRRQQQHQSSSRQASSRPPPDSFDEVRQKLIASDEYGKLLDRVGERYIFDDEGATGIAEEEAEDPAALKLLWSTLRFAADVSIVLVPVVLCVSTGKIPSSMLAPFGSAAAALKGSAIEPVLEALPWERAMVLKSAAEGVVAILLSPVTDRLIMTPAIHLWAQARLKYLAS